MRVTGIAIFLLAFAIAGVARAPAELIAGLLPEALRFSQARGTLWQGTAVIASGAAALPLRWHCLPEALLEAELAWKIELPQGQGGARVAIGPTMTTVATNDMTVAAELLAPLLPAPLPRSGWGGTLKVTAGNLECTRQDCRGRLAFDWMDLQQPLIGAGVVGSYRLALGMTQPSGTLEWTLQPLAGPLRLVGGGRIERSGVVRFSGEASVAAEDAARFEPLLSTIGQPAPRAGQQYMQWALEFPRT